MKKQLLPFFLFSLFLLTPINAIYGGEEITYHIDQCDRLTVTIYPYEKNEWSIYPNCTDKKIGLWECNCTDDWDINLKPKVNSVGTFNVTIDYTYSQIKETAEFSYPSHGGGIRYEEIILNVTKTITEPIYRTKYIKLNQTEYINQTIEVPIETTKPILPLYVWVVIIIVSFILGLLLHRILIYIYSEKEYNKYESGKAHHGNLT